MTSLFDKLNLRPQERRIVVVVGIVVFLVVNLVMVWPHFGDLGRSQRNKKLTQKTLSTYQDELKKKPDYERELRRLESLGGYVPQEEAALGLANEVRDQAAASSVSVPRWDSTQRSSGPRTNSIFDEAMLTITVSAGEKELVDFLYGLGSSESLIRVRSMNLQRDPSQFRLSGTLNLVKSYQRKPPKPATQTTVASAKSAKATPPPAKTNAPPAKAAVPPPTSRPPPTAVPTNYPRRGPMPPPAPR